MIAVAVLVVTVPCAVCSTHVVVVCVLWVVVELDVFSIWCWVWLRVWWTVAGGVAEGVVSVTFAVCAEHGGHPCRLAH